jgi:type IV secretion system protein VirB10
MSSVSEDQMLPESSPGEMSPNAGVRRVNNLPVYIIGGLMTIFLIVMVLVAADRADQQHQKADAKDEKTGNTRMFANEIAGIQQEGIIQAEPVKPLLVPESPKIMIARPDNLDAPPTPPLSGTNPHRNDELERIRLAKMQQLETAIKAKTEVSVTAPRSPGSTPGGMAERRVPTTRDEAITQLVAVRQQIDAQTHDDPTASYKAHLQQLQAALSETTAGGSTAPKLQTSTDNNKSKDLGQFADTGHGDRWKLDSEPEAPRTPYELRAGFVIPGMLISGINSELPGQIMAQVSQNVYDTATGKYLLLPQGSRLVGSYSSDVSFGQARVLVAWQRIVFPDGKAMDMGAMPGADSAGYAGFNDQVNNHYLRLYGSAFLMSAVTAGISYSQQQNQANNTFQQPTAGSAMSQALGQQLGQVTAQMIAKNLNVAPTLEIRPGFRFNVIVTKDMTFSKPYQAFDY